MTGRLLGARVIEGGARFGAFAPASTACAVSLFDEHGLRVGLHPMSSCGDGFFDVTVAGLGSGARYKLVLDDRELPDPFASWMPDGVHGASSVFRSQHVWRNAQPPAPRPHARVIYELHVGAFTTEGNYASASSKLPLLVRLGITTVELMPISSWSGRRGWGYDGVAHFAPFAPYGDPDELRAFIDAAHGLGLEVLLDMVYNHFGPDGNYLGAYCPQFFRQDVTTPWGAAIDYRHPVMRRYLLDSARFWLEEVRFDGLRLDAVYAIFDDSPTHVLGELAAQVGQLSPAKILIAEDERNEPAVIAEMGVDAVWADDFHHAIHVTLTGERDGYYAGYRGGAAEIAETVRNGWLYRGQVYAPTGRARGRPAEDVPFHGFVYCIQNHDQVGNRALGDRLHGSIGWPAYRSVTMLLLFLPMTPLLFMGQEWAASTPFLYFTDHDVELGRSVTEGRRREFAAFDAFANEVSRARIPDPQALSTFEASRLDWQERTAPEHARVVSFYEEMLRLRRDDFVLGAPTTRDDLLVQAVGDVLWCERRRGDERRTLLVNLGDRYAVNPIGAVSASTEIVMSTREWIDADRWLRLAPWDGLIIKGGSTAHPFVAC